MSFFLFPNFRLEPLVKILIRLFCIFKRESPHKQQKILKCHTTTVGVNKGNTNNSPKSPRTQKKNKE